MTPAMNVLRLGSILAASTALLACERTAPSAPASAPTPAAPIAASLPASTPPRASAAIQCLQATYTSPCGATAWELTHDGNEKTVAFVEGPGSPVGLSLDVFGGDNRYTICGRWSTFPRDDLECGLTPLFIADSFSMNGPVKRRHCDLDECADVAGPPRLVAKDLDWSSLSLDCRPDGACRIVDHDGPREGSSSPKFYVRRTGVGPFLLGMPAKEALGVPGFDMVKRGPVIEVRVAGEHVLDLALSRDGGEVAEIGVLTARYLTQAGYRLGMRVSETIGPSGFASVGESFRGEQTCVGFEHSEGVQLCFAGKARWSTITARDLPIASMWVVPTH